MRVSSNEPNFIFLVLLIALPAVAAVSFTPSIPELTQIMSLSKQQVGWMMTTFLLAYGVCQLLYGPLANALGRIKAIYIGLVLSVVGVAYCILSVEIHSYTQFLFARLLLALGSGCGFSLTFTIINDCYELEEARRKSAYASIGIMLVSSIAIFINGSLVKVFGWHSVFISLLIYVLGLFVLLMRQPETAKLIDNNAMRISVIWNKYYMLSNCRVLSSYSFIMGLFTATSFVFNVYAPIIVISGLGFNTETFGLLMLLPGVLYTFGNISAARCARFLTVSNSILTGMLLYAFGSFILLYGMFFHTLSLVPIMMGISIIFYAIPFVYSNAAVMALKNANDKSSSAAFMGSLNILSAFIFLSIVSIWSEQIESVMPIIFLIFVSGAFLIFTLSQKPVKNAIPGRFG